MSFIYENDELISQLLKAAQAPGGVAPGSTDPKTNVEFRKYLTVSQQLVNQLEKSLGIQTRSEGAESEVTSKTDAQMKVPDANTLGNFLEFIAQNEVAIDGKRVAYLGANDPGDTTYLPVDAERAIPLAQEVMKDGQRAAPEGSYWVNKDLIIKYIVSLLKAAKKEDETTQQFIKTMLGALIEKVNKIFHTKLTTDYQEPKKELPATEQLTTFRSPLDMKTFSQDGDKPLTYGDIANDTALINWVRSNNMGLVIEGREGGALLSNNPDFDYCVVLRVMFAKAQYLLRNQSSTVELKNKHTAFVQKLSDIAPSVTGKDGKPCQLAGGGGATPGAQPGQVTAAMFNQIISTLPFAGRDINFDRIKTFFRMVAPIMSNNTAATTHMAEVENTLMPQTLTQMRVADGNIPLGETLEQFASRLIDSEKPGIYKFLMSLNSILNGTRAVVENFYSQYGQQLNQMDRSYQARIFGQIGSNPTAASAYQKNADALRSLKADADQFKH